MNEQKSPGWIARLHGFGALILLVFLVQAVSGLYLSLSYQPNPATAWKSIVFIEKELLLGDFFFLLHRWGALVSVLLIIFHVLQMVWCGAYRKARALTWLSGLPLMLYSAAFMLTGFLLPWDFRAYWAALTMVNWLEQLPLFSSFLGWLHSAAPGGAVPVARWFVLHTVLLPFLTGVALTLHIFAMRRHDPLRNATTANGVAAAGILVGLCLLAIFGVHKPDFADPITTLPYPQPDWLFFLFFQVTRYMQSNLEMIGVFWLPAAVVLGLFLTPLIGRGAWARWPLFLVSLTLCVGLAVFTCRTGSTTPTWSCPACHKADFGEAFARPPETVKEYAKRYDNKWLALHYRYPQYFWMMDPDVPGW